MIRFAPSLLPPLEGAERYAQKLSGLLPGPSESKPPVAEFLAYGHFGNLILMVMPIAFFGPKLVASHLLHL